MHQSNLALVESLRSLLRVLSIHEKEIYRVTTENKYMLEFIFSQIPNKKSLSMEYFESEPNTYPDEIAISEGAVEHDFGEGEWSTAAEWQSTWDDENILPIQGALDVVKADSSIESTLTIKKRKTDKS